LLLRRCRIELMETLYQQTNALLQQVHFGLGALENAKDESDAQKTIQVIYEQLRVIDGNCERLGILVDKEPPSRRRNQRYKVDQLKFDCHSLHSAVSSMHIRLTNKWREKTEREELLTRRFRPNDSTHLPMDDGELLLNDRLHSSNSAVDELISHGSAILEQIRSQGFGIRGVKRKVLDIGQQLGLSSTTLRMIERRVNEDWVIFIIGCVIVLIFMYVFYRFWKG
uniref:Golgi SNAP receptor complex member 2 n=2 Tax=Toxocara canis TaxID=6265 RepID=A0A183UZ78_TOXCA